MNQYFHQQPKVFKEKSVFMNPDKEKLFKKRKSQVYDLLNKCKDFGILEEVYEKLKTVVSVK